MLDVHPWLYVEGNPAGIKGALSLLGLCSTELRLPLVPLSEKSLAGLRQAMQAWL
jgi:4-hydroxy-tetrahydrodipicolinate synthase